MNPTLTDSTSPAGRRTEYLRVIGLPAIVVVETEAHECIASLRLDDVDDIFGVGANSTEAIQDLLVSMRGACSHLAAQRSRLAPRLQRQLATLEMVVRYIEPGAKSSRITVATNRNGTLTRQNSSAVAFSRRFES